MAFPRLPVSSWLSSLPARSSCSQGLTRAGEHENASVPARGPSTLGVSDTSPDLIFSRARPTVLKFYIFWCSPRSHGVRRTEGAMPVEVCAVDWNRVSRRAGLSLPVQRPPGHLRGCSFKASVLLPSSGGSPFPLLPPFSSSLCCTAGFSLGFYR